MILSDKIVGLALVAQAAPEAKQVAKVLEVVDFGKVLTAVVVILIAYFANRFVHETLERLGEGKARRRLLLKKISSFTRLGIFVLASYLVIVSFLEGQENLLLGLGGTVAVAAGLALKDTVSSLVAGILILIDQPFQVGDRVQFQDTYGEVVEIGLRAVRIVTLDDNEVSVPNNKFLTESVASANAGSLDMMVVVKFPIAITEDSQLAKQIVYESCVTSRYVFLNKSVTMVIDEEETDAGLALIVKCKAYIIDARYEGSFVTDVTERVKRAFRKHRIQRPYHREYSVRSAEWSDYSSSEGEFIHGRIEEGAES